MSKSSDNFFRNIGVGLCWVLIAAAIVIMYRGCNDKDIITGAPAGQCAAQ